MEFSTLSRCKRAWLDDQPVQVPAQTFLYSFSTADHQKIRLKGIWREVTQLISLPNPWWWISNSCNSWCKFTVVLPISARSGICWKSFCLLCGLRASSYFAWKTGQRKGRRWWIYWPEIVRAQQGLTQPWELWISCSTNHFGLYNQFFRSSSEKDVTPP